MTNTLLPVTANAANGTATSTSTSALMIIAVNWPPEKRHVRRLNDDELTQAPLVVVGETGDAGRARVEAEFRADAMVERFATLYEDLARAKGLGATS